MISAPILVQKFGGTSVATPDRRLQVISHVRSARSSGFAVAVVVSAMGRLGDPYATDTLLALLQDDGGAVDPRDYDLMFTSGEAISVAVLAHVLRDAGIPAVAMTSAQAGIYTDGHHREAEIVSIDTGHLIGAMVRGDVPVITGAQGIAPGTLAYTTLGRGGSDTSGVAVGIALHAVQVEIFTDVEGVAVADPRCVPDARVLRQVSYEMMHELARFGATVLHPRAVAMAREHGIRLVVRSTFSDQPGTLIGDIADEEPIVGIAALPCMTTAVLEAEAVDPALRAEWEHVGIMSLIDSSSGSWIVGATKKPVFEIEAILGRSSLRIRDAVENCSWVSVVGDSTALAAAFGPGGGYLASVGIDTSWSEAVPRRRTYVVPDAARDIAVRELHGKAVVRATSSSGRALLEA